MSEIEKEILKKVMQWLNLADEDLNLASHALRAYPNNPEQRNVIMAQTK